jgi:hypothetical protein
MRPPVLLTLEVFSAVGHFATAVIEKSGAPLFMNIFRGQIEMALRKSLRIFMKET